MAFVLDNSVACGWFLPAQATAYTDAIAARLFDDRAFVPGLFTLEFASVLRSACKRGGLIAQQAQDIAAEMASLPIEADVEPATAGAILALALRFDLTSYDAAYLELALRRQIPIATQDAALAAAAIAAGIGVVQE